MSDGGMGAWRLLTPDLQYIALERLLEKTIQATMEKVVNDIKKSVQATQNIDENKYWPKEKINKPRDQFEYDEVVATRTFILRVAKREGWGASEIRDSSDEDPMDVYFQDKLASARQLAKNKRPKVGSSIGSPVLVLTGLLVGFVQSGLPPNLLPLQPVQSGFMQNMPQAYSNTVPNQNLYQQSYGSQGSSRPYGYNRFSRQGAQGSSRTTTSRRDHYSGTIRTERTMQKSGLETISGENRMGEVLIKRANDLAYCMINRSYRKRLVKAQQLFERFCSWMKESACPANIDTVKAFLGWLELAGMSAQVYEYLGAIVPDVGYICRTL
ncbi:16920_t:CDS:2 [Gigaspora margarita]|uniref:16920_t:CDS:1 n=1 Tax=Gigaspora margarita TaxID=4874 RepID=A0ABM8W0R0_GIGMA|nr:16920_t:CDS:2 [Gigaspora margarita]